MTDDTELLRRFVEDGSQEAFGELVCNRVNLVYAAALRQVGGDSHMAEDVTQAVFLQLAHEAPRLIRRPVLAGWLYTATRMLATNAVRAHRRWRRREQEANAMTTLMHDPLSDADWAQLRPVLDQVMHELDESDREAIILRYFDNGHYADVGKRIGLNENTARMRVERALDKLRARLAKRGVTSTAAALGTALTAQAVISAPAGLAAVATATSLAGAAGGIASGASLGLELMNITKQALGLGAAIALLGLGIHLVARNRLVNELATSERNQTAQLASLRAENLRLRTTLPALTSGNFGVPETKPANLGRLQAAADLLRSGLLGKTFTSPWFSRRDGKTDLPGDLDVGIDQIAAVFDLSSAESAGFKRAAEAARDEMIARLKAVSPVQRSGDKMTANLPLLPEANERFGQLLKEISELLGPERFAYFQEMGCAAALEDLFRPLGLEASVLTLSVTGRSQSIGSHYTYALARVVPDGRVQNIFTFDGWSQRNALNIDLGILADFVPLDL